MTSKERVLSVLAHQMPDKVPWGGLSVELLVSGTQDEVRKETRKALQANKPGGRYIFGSTHSIAVGTKYDNFMAMVEEFEKNRCY